MNKRDEVIFWGSMIVSLFGLFVMYSLITTLDSADSQFPGRLIALVVFAAITFFSIRAFLRVVRKTTLEVDALTPDSTEHVKPVSRGELGSYTAEQWARILPEKPGRIVWGHPDKSGPVKLSKINDIAAYIDKAIDVFYKGGSPELVETYLTEAGVRIPLPHGDGDPDYISYGEDQRPAMMAIIDEIRNVLKMVTDKDSTDPRKRLLEAGEDDIRTIERKNSSTDGGWLDELVSTFENDPRVIDLDWNSGYHYTTGESSGNAAVLAEEGAPEVANFEMKCIAADYPDLLDRFMSIVTPDDRKAVFTLAATGQHFGDGSIGTFTGLSQKLRDDERVFDLKKSTSRSYDGPEGTDDNHTAPEDIHEDHYLEFACRIERADDIQTEIEELIRSTDDAITLSVKKP